MIVALFQFLYYLSCHKLLKTLLRARVDVSALDVSALRRPLIIAANHPSRLDPFLLVLLPFTVVKRIVPFHSLTAAMYYDRWWIGPLARFMGAYRLAAGGWTLDDYLDDSLKLLDHGRAILLFPEARLTPEEVDRPAKAGVGQLALRTGVPILPLRIGGTQTVGLRNLVRRRIAVSLTAGRLIAVERQEPSRETAHQLAQQVMTRIRSL